MNIPIVKIGNSQGIRLPKRLLDRYQLGDSIELELKEDCIVMKPSPAVREGWSTAFQQAGEMDAEEMMPDFFPEDDALLDDLIGENLIEV
jgi:antitoxin MazE